MADLPRLEPIIIPPTAVNHESGLYLMSRELLKDGHHFDSEYAKYIPAVKLTKARTIAIHPLYAIK